MIRSRCRNNVTGSETLELDPQIRSNLDAGLNGAASGGVPIIVEASQDSEMLGGGCNLLISWEPARAPFRPNDVVVSWDGGIPLFSFDDTLREVACGDVLRYFRPLTKDPEGSSIGEIVSSITDHLCDRAISSASCCIREGSRGSIDDVAEDGDIDCGKSGANVTSDVVVTPVGRESDTKAADAELLVDGSECREPDEHSRVRAPFRKLVTIDDRDDCIN